MPSKLIGNSQSAQEGGQWFDYVRLPNPVEVKWTSGGWLSSITESLIACKLSQMFHY